MQKKSVLQMDESGRARAKILQTKIDGSEPGKVIMAVTTRVRCDHGHHNVTCNETVVMTKQRA